MLPKTKKNIITVCCLGLFVVIATLQLQTIKIVAFGQSDSLPFEIGDITPPNQNTSDTYFNDSNSTTVGDNDQQANCVMPPCPPGHACIQSCP